jgi:hypothetical protein
MNNKTIKKIYPFSIIDSKDNEMVETQRRISEV